MASVSMYNMEGAQVGTISLAILSLQCRLMNI